MTATVAGIERHPIKSHGREALAQVTLKPGEAMPWDRHWAVAHDAARLDPAALAWAQCVNFSRGAKAPALMGIDATLDEMTGTVTLTHPQRPSLQVRPDDPQDQARLIDWVRPLCPPDRAQPDRVVTLPQRGWTDTDYPSVSLLNLASNADLSARMGIDLSPRRWRANIWLRGLTPWVEEDWAGRRFALGDATVEIVERIVRCVATTANPATGIVDADTLGALQAARGARTMGVYARVVAGGRVAVSDRLEPL